MTHHSSLEVYTITCLILIKDEKFMSPRSTLLPLFLVVVAFLPAPTSLSDGMRKVKRKESTSTSAGDVRPDETHPFILQSSTDNDKVHGKQADGANFHLNSSCSRMFISVELQSHFVQLPHSKFQAKQIFNGFMPTYVLKLGIGARHKDYACSTRWASKFTSTM